jgi:hypothetical protein
MTLAELQEVAGQIERRYRMTPRQVVEYLAAPQQIAVPLALFANRKLGVMETIVKYLREEENLQWKEIAKLLNRDNRVVWTTYQKAQRKDHRQNIAESPAHPIPIKIFAEKKFASLETLAKYCKTQGMSNAEIAHALKRDIRTIWTVVNRK